MQINDVIARLSAEQPADRKAASDWLVARGAEAVGPVLDVLCDESSSVDWSVSARVLCEIGRPAFEPVRDALAAATGREVRRRCGWTFSRLKTTDPQVYLPALAHPSPAVRQSATGVFQQLKEQAEPYLTDLAELLGDPDEDVRQRAIWAFQEIGAVSVPHLHRIRRGVAGPRPAAPARHPGRRRAAALTALADIGGWDALDTADRTAVTRLIAVKATVEVPEPMHLCGSWYALPTTDQAAVLDAFGLTEPIPVTMRMGESAWNHDHHDWAGDDDHSACRRMYVTPVLDGWTLVFGSPHLDETGDDETGDDETGEAAARDDMLARCAALSSRFGAAHWYGASCGDGWTAWCIAERGEILRYYDVFEPGEHIGESHPAEQGLLLPHEDAFPDDAFDGIDFNDNDAFRTRWEQVKRDLDIPDEAHSTTIAARISVDPASLGPHTVVSGRAVLALTACNTGRPGPRGALRV